VSREYPRSRRVEHQIQRILAELLMREVKDPRAHGLSITAVDMSSDLSVARVYISLLDPDDSPEPALDALAKAAGFLRKQLARQLRLRQVPELRFLHDESAARASEISRLIDEARRRDEEGR
jgi:ribosome-binding factor A